MNETAIPVVEAAKDFLGLLQRVEARQESAILIRDGQPVARLVPIARPAATCHELAELWEHMTKLPPEEAKAFAKDVEDARTSLPPAKPQWD